MEENRQKVYIFVPILIVAIIAVALFWEWDLGAKLNPDKTAYNMIELAEMVNTQIDDGADRGSFYVKGISEEELATINDYLCSINGMVDRFTITEQGKDKMRIVFYYEISDNYYVMNKYLNDEEIPSDRPQAMKLYNRVVEILDMIIKPEMSDYEKELAIHDYLVSTCIYGQIDVSQEYAFRAYGAIVQETAVCNGYAEAMSLLLTCAGVENNIITGSAGDELHAWNQVCLDGEWYQVDATWDDPLPDSGIFVEHTYFNITDDMMDDSHTWNKEYYEECDSQKYNYYKKNGYVYTYGDLERVISTAASKNITGEVEFMVTDYNESKYTYDFIGNIPGLITISHSTTPLGDNHVIVIHFN